MSKLPVLRDQALNLLQEAIVKNVVFYKKDEPWLADFFGEHSWELDSKLLNLPDDLLILPDEHNDYDLENSRRLYEALHGLSLTQATDPRLWTYLTHVKYWQYMRKRWPVEKSIKGEDLSKAVSPLKDRYFLIGDRSRGVTRNGLARLWWAGYTCHIDGKTGDESYALAIPLFSKQDVFASFMERAFSKNRVVMKALLSILLERYREGKPFDDRQNVRDLAKYLVMVGGVTILDAIEFDRLSKLIGDHVNKLTAA